MNAVKNNTFNHFSENFIYTYFKTVITCAKQFSFYVCKHYLKLMGHCAFFSLVQELQELKQEKKQLQQKCEQQEQTLQEMGLHLSQSVYPEVLLIAS